MNEVPWSDSHAPLRGAWRKRMRRLAGGAVCAGMVSGLVCTGCWSARAPTREEVFQPVRTQVVPPPVAARSGPLALEEAINRALENSPDVADARAAADVALANVRAAGDLRDPELRVGWGEGEMDGTERSSGSGVERLILPRDYDEVLNPYEPPQDLDNDGVDDTPGGFQREKEGPTLTTDRASRTQSSEERFHSIALRVFPPNPWALAAQVSAARAALHAAEAEYFEARRLVEIEVRRLFAEGAFAEREAAALDRLIESRRRMLDAAREAMASGRYTQSDLLQFHRQYLDTVADHDKARRNAERVRHQLAALTRLPAATLSVSFASSVPAAEAPADWTPERLWELALENRGDLAALYWESMALRSEWRETEADRIPWFAHIQGGFAWGDEDTFDFTQGTDESRTRHDIQDPDIVPGGRYSYTERHVGEESDWSSGSRETEEWTVSAAITLPIFSWFSGKVEASRAEYRRAERAAHFARAQMRDDVAAALEQVRSLERIRTEYTAASLPVLKEMRDSLEEIRSSEAVPADELYKTEQEILDAERLLAQYEYEYAVALIDLREKVGALPSDRPAARPAGEMTPAVRP